MSALELTGERTLPGIPRENYWFRRHVAAYRVAARFVRGTVLDAGAGEGYGAALLARRAAVVAVDVDAASVAHATTRYAGVRFVRADLEAMPFRSASLDAVVALQVLEHLKEPGRFLRTTRRALRPGGVVVLSTPNRPTFPSGENPWHVREYDARELRALLEGMFEDVSLAGVAHGPILSLLDRLLGEPVQERLTSTAWDELPAWVRAALRSIRAGAFRLSREAERALDLVAIARSPR